MKNFCIKIVKFSLPCLVFILVTPLFYYYSKLNIDSKLNEISNYECLLMGDSQIQRFDGRLTEKPVKNIASSGEHYYFSFNKLKHLIKNKKHKIKQVILGVSMHNFAPTYSRAFNLDYSEGTNSLNRYLYFFNLFDESDFINLANDLPIIKLIKSVYYKPDWGGFVESNNSNPSMEIIKETLKIHYTIQKDEDEFGGSYQRDYLYKIDSLCTKNNIELILLSTPYHNKYKEKIKPEYYVYFEETLKKLNTRIHINFISEKVNSNFMSDANHLNVVGVEFYSKIIKSKITEKDHKSDNSKQY